MKREIEYGRDVIVAATFRGKLTWFVSEKEFWILDQQEWADAYKSIVDFSTDDHSDRFGIPVADEHTAADFLKAISSDAVTGDELQQLLRAQHLAAPDDIGHLLPSLWVDFDRCALRSNFPEPFGFENYAPEGWYADYGPILHLVPAQHRYWVIDGVDVLEKFK